MIDKSRDCDKCVHAQICAYRKQREEEIKQLEYKAKLIENQQFTYAVNCMHFLDKYGKTNIILPQRGEPTI